MLKRLFGQILLTLGEMEDEFREFYLQDDIALFIATAFCTLLANVIMLRVDYILFKASIHLFYIMILIRGIHVGITGIFIPLIYRSKRARQFDRLAFGWLIFNAIYFSLIKFTRPSNHLATSFDLLFIFGLYLLSPLPLKQTIALGLSFSIGTLWVGYSFKTEVSAFQLSSTVGAQVFTQIMGLVSAIQARSLRRRAFQAYLREKSAHEFTQDLLHVDALTKSLSRGYFFELATREFERSKRNGRTLSVMVFDLDHFKSINDTHGHHAGDKVLAQFARFIEKNKRSQDIFGRLGGEEFAALLPDVDLKDAYKAAKRFQTTWGKGIIKIEAEDIRSTTSVGVTQICEKDESFDDLLNRADALMYKAKQNGRNRVACK